MPATQQQINSVLPTVAPSSPTEAPSGASILQSHIVSDSVAGLFNLPQATKGGQATPFGQVVSLLNSVINFLSGYTDTAVASKSDLRVRQATAVNIGSVAAGQTAQSSVNLGKSFKLLRVEATAPCWFRLYSTTVYRSLDASRSLGTDLAPGNGLISEVNFAGQLGYDLDNTHGSSMESTSGTVAIALTNLSSVTAAITLTFYYLKLED